MKTGRLTVGIVDYAVGNQNSVLRCVRQLGFRVRISSLPDQLDEADVSAAWRGGFPNGDGTTALHWISCLSPASRQAWSTLDWHLFGHATAS